MANKLGELTNNGLVRMEAYEEDDQFITREVMDGHNVDRILDRNKADAHLAQERLKSGANSLVAARVPIVLFNQWKKEWRDGPKKYGVLWRAFLAGKVNDPNHANLRFMKI